MRESSIAPHVFVIMGITGDLAHRKILPALHALDAQGRLPERFVVLGAGRRDLGEDVEPAASELRVRCHVDAHEQVAARPASDAGRAHSFQAQSGAGRDPGTNAHRGPGSAAPAVGSGLYSAG